VLTAKSSAQRSLTPWLSAISRHVTNTLNIQPLRSPSGLINAVWPYAGHKSTVSKSVALPIILDSRETLLDVVCGDAKFFSPELKKLRQRLHSPLDAVPNSNATRQLRCTVQDLNLQPSD
jgi:hypothetical protein